MNRRRSHSPSKVSDPIPCQGAGPRQFEPKPRITREQIEQIVDDYLRRESYVCSPEYRLGIVDMLCARAFQTNAFARFERGTVQAYAYWAGFEHSFALWQEVTRKGGF